MFQAATSIFLTTISTIIAVITVVGSYKVLSPSPQYNPMDLLIVVILIIIVIVIMIVIMRHYVAKIVEKATDSWRVIMESIEEIHYFRRKSIEAYINKLDEYCRMLIDNSCRADYDVLCLDLNALKSLINKQDMSPRV
jgi:ABC-type bacteriocin/lantibiotic exporter with double-glycine peptidase domain